MLKSIGLACCIYFMLALGLAPAHAAETGERAPDIAGWDLVGQRSVRLSDYAGEWVLLKFWASWCGPCMHELPEFVEAVRPMLKQGQLKVITVSLDTPDTLPELRRAIKKSRLDFPVLYDGGEFSSVPAVEWGLDEGIPCGFLINPAGVLVARESGGPRIAERLKFYQDNPNPLLMLDTWHNSAADGSLQVFAHVTSPSHAEVELSLHYFWEKWGCAADDPQRFKNSLQTGHEQDLASARIVFSEFGDAVHAFVLPAPAPDIDIAGYYVVARLPGSETLDSAGQRRISCGAGDQQAWVLGVEYDEELKAWRHKESHRPR